MPDRQCSVCEGTGCAWCAGAKAREPSAFSYIKSIVSMMAQAIKTDRARLKELEVTVAELQKADQEHRARADRHAAHLRNIEGKLKGRE